jgi:hypothetical protein
MSCKPYFDDERCLSRHRERGTPFVFYLRPRNVGQGKGQDSAIGMQRAWFQVRLQQYFTQF